MRKQKSMLVLAIITAFMATALFLPGLVSAGDLEPATDPDDPGSAMYTMDDIYNRLNDNTTATKRSGAFTEPSEAPGSTGRTMDQIYELALPTRVGKTEQTICYDALGVVISCVDTGQDGEIQAGVLWPVPRFTDNGDGTVTDNLTGLIWLEQANYNGIGTTGTATWEEALAFCNALESGQCGLTDDSVAGAWRLPNVRELHSLIHYGFVSPAVPNTAGTDQWAEEDPFLSVRSGSYWSSTAYEGDSTCAWYVTMYNGSVSGGSKTFNFYVWPVRGDN